MNSKLTFLVSSFHPRVPASSPLYYITHLTALFESIGLIVDQHQPVVEKYYGPGRMRSVVGRLQQEGDRVLESLVSGWEEERRVGRMVSTHIDLLTALVLLELRPKHAKIRADLSLPRLVSFLPAPAHRDPHLTTHPILSPIRRRSILLVPLSDSLLHSSPILTNSSHLPPQHLQPYAKSRLGFDTSTSGRGYWS